MTEYLDESTVIRSSQRWMTLPPTPTLPTAVTEGYAPIDNIKLWYATFGVDVEGQLPIICLHGGLGNSDWMGLQVRALMPYHKVITVDSRGHGRSTTDFDVPMSYDLMADGIFKLLDYLKIPKASFLGWSDGAIVALIVANNHPDRVDKIYAFSPHHDATTGVKDIASSTVFTTYIGRTISEYARISPTPERHGDFMTQMTTMWGTYPHWTADDLKNVNGSKVWVVDGDYEEAIERTSIEAIVSWLPDSGLLILPQTSHFAHIQDPEGFNEPMLRFFGTGALKA